MRMKIDKNRAQDEQKRYCLTNSIIPAIQGHIQIVMNIPYTKREMLLDSALSNKMVYETLQNSCRHVQNWTIGQDFGPFQQINPIDFKKAEPYALGQTASDRISAKEFLQLKMYLIDPELAEEINTLFNPALCMFYIDNMGNLLSNLKLAFYENGDDKNFISKMIFDGNVKTVLQNQVRSYAFVTEIYDEILTSVRWK